MPAFRPICNPQIGLRGSLFLGRWPRRDLPADERCWKSGQNFVPAVQHGPLPIPTVFQPSWENIPSSGSPNANGSRTRRRRQSSETAINVAYNKGCRIGGTLTLGDFAETSEIGDWKMPDFRAACAYAVSQGWLIVEDDALRSLQRGCGRLEGYDDNAAKDHWISSG